MKKLLLTLTAVVLALSNSYSQSHNFVHPGIPWTINDLNEMKDNRDVFPWSEGWDLISNSSQASLDYRMQGPAVNVDRRDNNITNDGDAALYHALQWYFTGNSEHATKGVDILDAWATTHRTWSGNSVHLHAAWRGGTLVKAAEILRHTYPGWTSTNTRRCEDYFEDVIWPQFRIPDPVRAANQGANNIWGAIQIAIFCNDQQKFQQCLDAFLLDACGGISNTLPNGQNGDTGRDQGHAMGMIGNLVSVAEIAWAQGVDLYGVLDNRLLAVHEYWCRYNAGSNVPFIDHGTCYGYYTSIGSQGRDPASVHSVGLNEKVYGAYVVRKGLSAPNVTAYRNRVRFDEDTFLFRKDSGYDSDAPIMVESHPEFEMENVVSLTSRDIGSVGRSGSSSYNNGTWTVNGSGSDLYGGGSEDSFHFAYTEMSGDGAFIARINSVENTNSAAKAAVVIRESLSANSKMAAVSGRPTAGTEFSARGFDAADGSGGQVFSLSVTPTWIKIERRGNSIVGFVGPDGVTWAPMQNTHFSMSNNYYIGLGVTARNNSTVNTSTFTNVQKSVGIASSTFTPDPSKTYYIDSPVHNLRIGATGEGEDPYTTSTSSTGDDVEWKFIAKGNGSWHIQRAAGGSKPRLRSRNNGEADMQSTGSSGNRTYYDFASGSSGGTFFATLPDITNASYKRIQVASNGDVNFVPESFSGSWESLRFTEVTASSSDFTSLRKRNASGFAMDGGGGGENGQNVYLYSFSGSNVNQQWEEIDRGGGYFSYVKRGTSFALDGGRGGADGQNLYLWSSNARNYNQQWRKVSVSGNIYRLEKRNASGFSLDGGRGGSNEQNVYMWNTNSNNQNQHWIFE